ncbi:hypothetical protein [Metabacillus halosaccharovorans]|uniref:hypothetical protein n=1 Tax=Metabacillus halosaccharovorans TaxID=930124 RepID=UPI001C1F5106|nr:hypothetical protein [Metabacillus halosaccharovorans]MBU7594834.1 hypothetical protein [Metabacillus halosaccharovorans]
MKKFFSKPSKVALLSLIATIVVTILLLGVLSLAGVDSKVVHLIGKVTIGISLPFLILNPLVGLIYSFFIKGKIKILYILLHLACIWTISVFAFISFMFRYFVPFAP